MSQVILSKDQSFEEWAEEGVRIQRQADQLTWELADWAGIAQQREWPLKEYCAAHGLSYDSAKRAGMVARAIPEERRKHQLSFGYYQEVCGLAESKQEKWLTYAKQKELSLTNFRALLRESEAENGNALLSDGESLVFPTKGIMDTWAWIQNRPPDFWTPQTKGFWKKQLEPLAKFYESL
jgi:hypothetical protein